MSDLPPPLVPADADLRDFEYMALEVRLLRDSRFAAQVSGDAFRAGVLLWCAAWHQVPAGSVPDDDIELASLAGYGRFVKEWRKVREEALIGFVKCADGRLYHEVVCKKVREALDARSRHAYEKCCDRLRKKNAERRKAGRKEHGTPSFDQWKSGGFDEGIPPPSDGIPPEDHGKDAEGGGGGGGDPAENALIGKGSEGKGKLKPNPLAAGAARPKKPDEDPVKREVWTTGRTLLEGQGMTHDQAGTFLGKLVKDHGQVRVLEVIREAARDAKADLKTWLVAACQERGRAPKPTGREAAAAAIFSDAPSLASREVIDGFAERVV